MRPPRVALPLLAVALLAPRVARAQATALDPVAVGTAAVVAPAPALADDVIVLRSGAILRGRAAEVQPGSFARIAPSDGTVRTVAWSEIASASGGSFGAATPLAASSPADPARARARRVGARRARRARRDGPRASLPTRLSVGDSR